MGLYHYGLTDIRVDKKDFLMDIAHGYRRCKSRGAFSLGRHRTRKHNYFDAAAAELEVRTQCFDRFPIIVIGSLYIF